MRLSLAEQTQSDRVLLLEAYWQSKGDRKEMSLDERVKEMDNGWQDGWDAIISDGKSLWTKEVHAACHSGDLPTAQRLWHPWAVNMDTLLPVPVSSADDLPFLLADIQQGSTRVSEINANDL